MDKEGWLPHISIISPSVLTFDDVARGLHRSSISVLILNIFLKFVLLMSLSHSGRIAAKNQEWCPIATVHISTNL